jgi:signal transduction histidine kinase
LQVRLRAVGLDAPLWIQGDGEQLGIAAANLLRNACDALALVAPGQRQLLVRLQRQRTRACFTVADSGPGLPQHLAGLQAHGSAKLGGMGLGLVIVQAIAEAHGGELLAGRSRALGGAELRLRLPSRR